MATSKVVILNKPSDWHLWMSIIQGLAEGRRVWSYIDLSIDTPTQLPSEPSIPLVSTVNPVRDNLVDLSDKEMVIYRTL